MGLQCVLTPTAGLAVADDADFGSAKLDWQFAYSVHPAETSGRGGIAGRSDAVMGCHSDRQVLDAWPAAQRHRCSATHHIPVGGRRYSRDSNADGFRDDLLCRPAVAKLRDES